MDEAAKHWLSAGKELTKGAVETAAVAGQLASPFLGPPPAQADLSGQTNSAHVLQLPDYEQQGLDWVGLKAEEEAAHLSDHLNPPDPGLGEPPF